ncbi:DUF3857 domain-containing protein [Segetibacter sp. 3557_3]|uniref:DUF3857 domain-containing transglutaminase family protein n=1 Tax=Segetibacter sp. 3557_3 TaxID=2547429 RepID=UPI0010586185|nr:DUF3857 domain-containing transglutaminase family protein [Segetibacter sp. 3557_3]TDH18372.1 DUF3857 domain-containing protein [Segetibacter sp. 3557_3]
MKPLLTLTLMFCFFVPVGLLAQTKYLGTSKAPQWITLNPVDYNSTTLESEAEDGCIDIALEQQRNLAKQTVYVKRSMRILSETGVENNSDISISFDPAYEKIILHTVRIMRNNQTIDKLQISKFKTVQQEEELARHLYNGSLTAFLALEDVRKGDVIEYSYSRKGTNPIFAGKFADVLSTRFRVPVLNLYYKVIVPAGRKLNISNRLETVKPIVSSEPQATVYEWKLNNVGGMQAEENTPSWYDPYPVVLLSEYSSWNEVSRWANTLFPATPALGKPLEQKVAQIVAENVTTESRVLAALQFVQDDIRYMGVEVGVNSHKPHDPNKIFTQRFGDCKDKSYLLVTMLNRMNVAARPVLINTTAKHSLKDWLPAATAFDHVTVRAEVNGKAYWLDPTISFQRGPLSAISYPDYQCGLVVSDTTTALSTIPLLATGSIATREIFDVPDMSGTVKLTVITTNTGTFADDNRYNFNSTSNSTIKGNYKKFYAGFFEKIAADSLSYKDDEKTGAFITYEYYTIKNAWTNNKGSKEWMFSPYIISSILKKPTEKQRSMPYKLQYPARYTEDVEINLPEAWNFTDFNRDIACAGFTMHAESSHSRKQVVLNYDYTAVKDHVTPEELKLYFEQYAVATEHTSFNISYDDTGATGPGVDLAQFTTGSTNAVFVQLYLLLGACVLVTILLKRRNKQNARS